LGKLLQVGTMSGSTWTMSEILEKPCNFILPDNQMQDSSRQISKDCKDHKDSHMMVEIIIYKTDRDRILKSLNFDGSYDKIPNNPNELFHYVKNNLASYIEEIEEYGFNHIIIFMEFYFGIAFLDCYGRVFAIECIDGVLSLFGNYFEVVEITAKRRINKFMKWLVEYDGSVIDITSE
jgi:hypothetical protein